MRMKLSAVFCASGNNDLVLTLRRSGYEPVLADDPQEALESVPEDGAVFLLADEYPCKGPELSTAMLKRAREKNVKLYVEYPQSVLGKTTGEPQTILYERLVAPDGFFGSMENGAIFMLNGCWHRPFHENGAGLLCLAKVAGYDHTVYGLPEDCWTVLDWLDEKKDALVATSRLSSFITGRYAPTQRWRTLWQTLLRELGLGEICLDWECDVTVEADEHSALPEDAIRRAWQKNVEWFRSYMIGKISPETYVFEGFESAIDYSGRQFVRTSFRGDCMGETAMVLGYGWKQTGNPELRKVCENIVDRVLAPGVFYHNDPESSKYGLNNWFANGEIFYGDDNARMLLGVMSARDLLGDACWDERILRCILANLRTSDKNGLRHPSLRAESFIDKSWFDYYNEETEYVSPHYQAYLWAAFLWMYKLTGIKELLTKSEKAISIVMERFPDKLRWQNSLTGEISRMLLPLSFLVRVHPTEQNRKWLRQAVDAMLEYQQPCGAIRDAFGDLSLGKYPPPKSNENYGTAEASLIQQNGDPATDLLYTTNWAFIGLWEASLVMEDAYVREAYEKLRNFLLRIQVRSKKHPELDGTWMRSFDYEKWEYWGSAADIGWSAWSIESGWVNTWISTTLMLEERGESLMRLDAGESFSALAEDLYKEMMTPRITKEKAVTGTARMAGSSE